ncbi:XdhC/CoxI family protein [Neobacillus mesonae]|uniref:XdhC family protein n=1 Tax=Neobacillus mesonae TaxID=1193713 RepID=UPI00203D178B|nr:XdhC/CoxI family protein [Neobacillus mesonae]MCM3571104.1 XdhC family protein [Neobacillus mesonae]
MNDICRLLKIMKEKEKQLFAMATICRVDGSAYRREGARMLIMEDGSYYGTISAGCLEQDLIYQAEDVIKSLSSKTVQYDLKSEDDLSWGQNAGCDGNIEVYIEPMGWQWNKLNKNIYLWPYIEEQLNKGIALVSVKCLSSESKIENVILYSENGSISGPSIDQDIQRFISPLVNQFLKEGRKAKYIHVNELEDDFLFELYEPKDHLYVFGAGPDAEPLVRLASQVDFTVSVIDPRESRCNETFFPHADHLFVEHPGTFFTNRSIPKNSFVIVMTHNFNRDKEIVNHLLQFPPKYLGVLGPRRRTDRLVENKNALPLIHSPIGLDINAEGPDEISISVLGELIKVRNRFQKELRIQRTIECQI